MSETKLTGYPSIDKTHLEGIDPKKLNPTILSLSLFMTFLLINHKSMGRFAIIRAGKLWTKYELKRDTLLMARALRDRGLRRGHTIAIQTPNVYEGIVITLAANAIGIKVMYCDVLGKNEQLFRELHTHEADVLVVYEQNAAFVDTILQQFPLINGVINITKDPGSGRSSHRYATYAELMEGAQHRRSPWLSILRNAFSKKDAIYLQTSGSTSGMPKGLPFSNENVFASLIYAKNSTGTNTHDARVDKVLCILPYRFPYGWMTIFVNLLGGNLVELATGATPKDIGNWHHARPSYIYGTPRFLSDFMAQTPENADLSFLRAFFCSGFNMSEAEYEKGIAYFRAHNSNAEIRTNYGIGEALCVGTASDGVPHRPNTSGKFYVGPTWVIVDENFHEVKYDEIGEVLVSSKTLCNGYFGEPEKTKQNFIEFRGQRFFRSGDLMSLSRDGYVTYIDRKKRFYQPVGATDKVNCETIEAALLELTNFVKECSVVVYGDTSQAFVVLHDNIEASDATRETIFTKLKHALLDFQLPSKINFLPELPYMSSGKVDLKKLESLCQP